MSLRFAFLIASTASALALAGCGAANTRSADSASESPQVISQSVHGTDDRMETMDAPANLQHAAESVVALMKGVAKQADGSYKINPTFTVGKNLELCHEEPYSQQPIGAFCSGVLIAPDQILTAGHCVQGTQSTQNGTACPVAVSYVFGFKQKADGTANLSFPASDVYKCKSIKFSHFEQGPLDFANVRKDDFAIIQLDRPVIGRTPLKLRSDGSPKTGDTLSVIGHPEGAPQKVAIKANATVGHYDPYILFSNVDVFPSNSGSPMINPTTLEVEGVVTGEDNRAPGGGTSNVSTYLKDPTRYQCWGTYCRTGCWGYKTFSESERRYR